MGLRRTQLARLWLLLPLHVRLHFPLRSSCMRCEQRLRRCSRGSRQALLLLLVLVVLVLLLE